jgi:hypothetical protein
MVMSIKYGRVCVRRNLLDLRNCQTQGSFVRSFDAEDFAVAALSFGVPPKSLVREGGGRVGVN